MKAQKGPSTRTAKLCGLVVALVLAAFLAGSALAYYTSTGSGDGQATVGTLSGPKSLAATPGAGTVELSWDAVTPPAPGSVSYYVSRDGASVGGSCGDRGSPIGDTNCTDSGLRAGTYSYTVTTVWRSWTATGSSGVSVTPASGAASRIVLSGSTDDLQSGSTRQLTATVEDAAGNTVTSGPDSRIDVSFQQQSGHGSISGTGSATASAGVATATITGVHAGPVDLTAGATPSGPAVVTSNVLGFTVTPGTADARESTLTPLNSSIAADGSATQALTVQARDANGNDETNGGGAVTLTSASGTGTIGPVTDNGDGTYTATVTAPATAGSGVFVATLEGSPVESASGSQTQATVSYVSNPAAGIVLSGETVAPDPALSCSGPVGAMACSSYDEPNTTGNMLTARLTLVDRFGLPVTNTGLGIAIDLSTSGTGPVGPSGDGALTIPTGASSTSASFTAARHNGNNKTLTVTAAVHGTSETLTIVLSSGAPADTGSQDPPWDRTGVPVLPPRLPMP